MRRPNRDQSRDLELDAQQYQQHICKCGQPLGNHEWPLGGCPESGCTAFVLDMHPPEVAHK